MGGCGLFPAGRAARHLKPSALQPGNPASPDRDVPRRAAQPQASERLSRALENGPASRVIVFQDPTGRAPEQAGGQWWVSPALTSWPAVAAAEPAGGPRRGFLEQNRSGSCLAPSGGGSPRGVTHTSRPGTRGRFWPGGQRQPEAGSLWGQVHAGGQRLWAQAAAGHELPRHQAPAGARPVSLGPPYARTWALGRWRTDG